MSCNKCKKDPCNPCECCEKVDCGCKKFYDAACVRFNKKDLPCIGKPKGTDLEQIIEALDEKACNITDGVDGLSAYELAVSGGYEGTEQEWLDSLNGEDCPCNELAVYREDALLEDFSSLGNLGNWGDMTDLATLFPGVVTNYSHTVPTGGAGDYEVTFQSTIQLTAGEEPAPVGAASEVYVNGTAHSNSLTLDTVDGEEMPFTSMTMFVSNITLAVGDVIEVRLAVNNKARTSFKNSKLKIEKLA